MKKLVTNTLGFSIWQLDYYDCVSFSEKAYDAFIAYVHNNPAVWYIKDKAEPDIPRK
ncbi:MAG: hypothetical protein IJS90_06060 [Clostridia bacterium]|nr:hypothetical protein [Clostridia bacterium]